LADPDATPLIVAISGRPGSGKSVVAREAATRLGLRHVSAGDFMREMATERGMSILELSRVAEVDPSIDAEIDARTVRLGATGDSLVIDSRMAWHFIPESVKVFLDVRTDVAARRIYASMRETERENVDQAATEAALVERTSSEAGRYLRCYGVDYLDTEHYDVVIDTSAMTVDGVVDLLLAQVRSIRPPRQGGGSLDRGRTGL
jgi:predicted cytidylate kinase